MPSRPTLPPPAGPSGQRGVVLIEVMVAILVFSVGVLAIVGLQATMIKSTADAKYRADATYIAQSRIGHLVPDHDAERGKNFRAGFGRAGRHHGAAFPLQRFPGGAQMGDVRECGGKFAIGGIGFVHGMSRWRAAKHTPKPIVSESGQTGFAPARHHRCG